MEYHKTLAITLNRQNFRESSQRVTFYTRDYGKINGLARGAQKFRSDFEGPFDLLNYVQLTYLYQPTNSLYLITGSKVYDNFLHLRENYALMQAGVYLANFVETLTPLEDKNHKLFDLFLAALEMINHSEQVNDFAVFSFEAQALKYLGYLPLRVPMSIGGQTTTDVTALLNTLAGGKVSFDCLRASSLTLKKLRRFLNYYVAQIAGDKLICAPLEMSIGSVGEITRLTTAISNGVVR